MMNSSEQTVLLSFLESGSPEQVVLCDIILANEGRLSGKVMEGCGRELLLLDAACSMGYSAVAEWASENLHIPPPSEEDPHPAVSAFRNGHYLIAEWCVGKCAFSEKHLPELLECVAKLWSQRIDCCAAATRIFSLSREQLLRSVRSKIETFLCGYPSWTWFASTLALTGGEASSCIENIYDVAKEQQPFQASWRECFLAERCTEVMEWMSWKCPQDIRSRMKVLAIYLEIELRQCSVRTKKRRRRTPTWGWGRQVKQRV